MVDLSDKSSFGWISVIRLPDFVAQEDVEWAVREAGRKKKMDCSACEMITVDEGLCVQMMHIGPYDSEPETVAAMDAFLEENGYENDIGVRQHHEIYISDPNKTASEKRKTIIRYPIRKRV